MKKILSTIGLLLTSGCALLNPYESSFSCPETANGKCVSVQTAYRESKLPAVRNPAEPVTDRKEEAGTKSSDSACFANACSDRKSDLALNSSSPENRYRSALFDTFSGLLKEPVAPIIAPPRTMRVLLLPYTGQENEFYMLRYVYFFVDEPRWLLGDTVSSGEEE